jgi:CHASE2 domain-containing sensor protein
MAGDDERLTLLYCGANPVDKSSNYVDVLREAHAIRDAVAAARLLVVPEIAATHELLLSLLRSEQPWGLHFGVHGIRPGARAPGSRDFGGEVDARGALMLLDAEGVPAPIEVDRLVDMFRVTGAAPRCVLLSACYSSLLAEELARHVDVAVGMEGAVSDAGAIAFSAAFYARLSSGYRYQQAFEEARLALPHADYHCPKLYIREGFSDDPPVPTQARQARVLLRLGALVALLVGLAAVLTLAYGEGPFARDIRLALLKERSRVAPPIEDDRLRVVLIDKKSEESLMASSTAGRYGVVAWRRLYAQALHRLSEAGAQVVAFDVLFDQEPADNNGSETSATSELAKALQTVQGRGTRVVLAVKERDVQSGRPKLAQTLSRVLVQGQCAVAHSCIAKPNRLNVPILPLVIDTAKPIFALSLCAYALAEGQQPTILDGKILIAKAVAELVATTGLEYGSAGGDCLVASRDAISVHRFLPPFTRDIDRRLAEDVVDRHKARVIPFERVLAEGGELDVRGKVVLVGAREVWEDKVFDDAAPDGHPLWGLSVHVAALDALFAGSQGLVEVILPTSQLLWIAGLCLVSFMVWRSVSGGWWRPVLLLVLLAALDVAVCVLAARAGLLTDPGNHVAGMTAAVFFAEVSRRAKRKRLA